LESPAVATHPLRERPAVSFAVVTAAVSRLMAELREETARPLVSAYHQWSRVQI